MKSGKDGGIVGELGQGHGKYLFRTSLPPLAKHAHTYTWLSFAVVVCENTYRQEQINHFRVLAKTSHYSNVHKFHVQNTIKLVLYIMYENLHHKPRCGELKCTYCGEEAKRRADNYLYANLTGDSKEYTSFAMGEGRLSLVSSGVKIDVWKGGGERERGGGGGRKFPHLVDLADETHCSVLY